MSSAERLPDAVADNWAWQLQAACRGVDSELFFHPAGERDPSRTRRDLAAKAVCARCPVLRPCFDYALAVGEPYGVWGGMSEDERAALLTRRGAGAGVSRTA
jgi:WhiB family redox-sensing transcriptional regulator